MTVDDKKAIEDASQWLEKAAKHTPPENGAIQVSVQYRHGKVHLIQRDVKESLKPQRT